MMFMHNTMEPLIKIKECTNLYSGIHFGSEEGTTSLCDLSQCVYYLEIPLYIHVRSKIHVGDKSNLIKGEAI